MPAFLGKDLYQVKITLVGSNHGSKPLIWRRLIVPKSITLDELHMVIQEAMGWLSYHLHVFSKENSDYPEITDFHTEDSKDLPLITLLRNRGEKLTYWYDMGDCWEHRILVEKSSLPDDQVLLDQVPICIKGNGICPAEDSGGIVGYYNKLKEAKNSLNPDCEWLQEWLEEDMDTRKYDIETINKRLSNPYSPKSERRFRVNVPLINKYLIGAR